MACGINIESNAKQRYRQILKRNHHNPEIKDPKMVVSKYDNDLKFMSYHVHVHTAAHVTEFFKKNVQTLLLK